MIWNKGKCDKFWNKKNSKCEKHVAIITPQPTCVLTSSLYLQPYHPNKTFFGNF